jgi:hypothetical protein
MLLSTVTKIQNILPVGSVDTLSGYLNLPITITQFTHATRRYLKHVTIHNKVCTHATSRRTPGGVPYYVTQPRFPTSYQSWQIAKAFLHVKQSCSCNQLNMPANSLTGEWMYTSHTFNLGTSWRSLVTFTPRPSYLRR